MGRQVEKLKAERRIDRSIDPHAWAEEMERGHAWRTMVVTACAMAVVWLGWQVYSLKQDVQDLRAQAETPDDCVQTPGPSGQMPPPGFC